MSDQQRDDKSALEHVGSRELAEWAIESAKLPGTWEAKAAAFLATRSHGAAPTRCSVGFEHMPHDFCDGNPGAEFLPPRSSIGTPTCADIIGCGQGQPCLQVREAIDNAVKQLAGFYGTGPHSRDHKIYREQLEKIAMLASATPSASAASMIEAKRLLGEWLKKSDAHRPAINEFKGGYQPFLERATREFLAAPDGRDVNGE